MADVKKKVVVKGLAKAYLSTEPEVEEVVVKKSPKKGREKKPAVPKASEVAASIRKKERDFAEIGAEAIKDMDSEIAALEKVEAKKDAIDKSANIDVKPEVKAEAKKEAPKKAEAKKEAPKKAEAKKAEVKKEAPKLCGSSMSILK